MYGRNARHFRNITELVQLQGTAATEDESGKELPLRLLARRQKTVVNAT